MYNHTNNAVWSLTNRINLSCIQNAKDIKMLENLYLDNDKYVHLRAKSLSLKRDHSCTMFRT